MNVRFIDESSITEKRVLLRADFDVSLHKDHSIANDERIQRNIPTLLYLLKKRNKVICIAKLDRPEKRDKNLSLSIVVKRLRELLPGYTVTLIDDFLTENKDTFKNQKENEVFVLENIRFYPEEKANNLSFASKLADLGDVYVNDAFAMCHRSEASVTGVPKLLPSYGGLLLKREIKMIKKALKNPKKPFVAIIGGAKIKTKINVIDRLITLADYLLIGGGLANTFFLSQGISIGSSINDQEEVGHARNLLSLARKKGTKLILPVDVVVGNKKDEKINGNVVSVGKSLSLHNKAILDIGPETEALFGSIISSAKTIVWNGPMGLVENPVYARGTDFLFYAIAHNKKALSVVGGGDTISAISNKKYIDNITHISTGGGAMLEYIEKGTLPGLEALV